MQRPVKGQKSGSENRTSFLESKLHCPPGKSAKMSILAVTLKNEDPDLVCRKPSSLFLHMTFMIESLRYASLRTPDFSGS